MDAISVSYVLVTTVLMLPAYRKAAPTALYWILATTPYWILLFGSIAFATLSLVFDLAFFLLYLLIPDPWDWRFTAEVLQAPYLAITLVSALYCAIALAAIGGPGAVRDSWTTQADTSPAGDGHDHQRVTSSAQAAPACPRKQPTKAP
ncbi:hypothetical protein ACQPZF_17210 [Actinosynnema sp. CS-041913]|uniref:hypothetical protein n=1 Tax=Actinosynnema sp. CS-041913 TaxID=3239917 RepID=UPI003D8DD279